MAFTDKDAERLEDLKQARLCALLYDWRAARILLQLLLAKERAAPINGIISSEIHVTLCKLDRVIADLLLQRELEK